MTVGTGGTRRLALVALVFAVTACATSASVAESPSESPRDLAAIAEPSPEATAEPTVTAEPAPTPTPAPQVVGQAPNWRHVVAETPGEYGGDLLLVSTPMFEGGTYTEALGGASLASVIDAVTDEFLAESAVNPHTPGDPPTVYELTGEVLFTAPGIVSIHYELFTQISGAAHPNLDYLALVVDLTDGRILGIDDYFTGPEAIAEVNALVRDAIATTVDVDGADIIEPVEVDAPWVALAPTLTGMQVAFGRSEVLPSVYGEGALVEIAWADLSGLVPPLWAEVVAAPHGEAVIDDHDLPDTHGHAGGLAPDLPFGTPTDDVLNTLGVLLGPSTGDTGFGPGSDACAEPFHDTIRVVAWGDLDLVFTHDGGLVEWLVVDRGFGNGVAFTTEGIGIGSTVAEVDAAYGPDLANGVQAMFPDDPGSPGIFALDDDTQIFIGTTTSTDPDGTVTAMWAGSGCQRLFL